MAERPRCGRLMQRYDWPGQVEGAVCGMPAGHRGYCLSEAAWRRKLDANKRGVQAARRARQEAGRAA